MKTFTLFFVVCLGLGMTNAGGVPLDIGKALKQVGTYMFGRVTGIDLSNFGEIQDKFSQLKNDGDQESYLEDLASSFVAKAKDSPFLQGKSVSEIMSTYKDNIREFLVNGIPNLSPSWQAGLDNDVLGLNKTEYQKLMGTHPEPSERRSQNVGSSRSKRQTTSLPKSVDWRTKGAVTPVKNQAQCGSCWAFATIGALEGRIGVKTGKAPVLSEQNLVDCAKNVNGSKCCQGCDGGFMTDGYSYVQLNDGIASETSYPYEAVDGECRYDPSGKQGHSVGYEYTKQDDEKDLMRAVAEGPVAVAVDANAWSAYKKGVFKCHTALTKAITSVKINHGVTIVGYGRTEGGLFGIGAEDFWIVKNSWGPTFGEDGYIRIARNSGNQCGIASQANYPLV